MLCIAWTYVDPSQVTPRLRQISGCQVSFRFGGFAGRSFPGPSEKDLLRLFTVSGRTVKDFYI